MINIKDFNSLLAFYGSDYAGGSLNQRVVENMIDSHVNNKEHIFKLFGNKLKIEKEVDLTVNDYEASVIKQSLIDAFKDSSKLYFAKCLLKSINSDEFCSNILKRDLRILNVSLKKGMKVSKALMNMVLPEDQFLVSTEHSMAYQKLSIKGKVVLSIDPIDYITMSSNDSGWRSCHRLNGGEFRTGPLAYLNDSSTVICYVESSNKCKVATSSGHVEHSNKSWRQIALVSPDLTFSIQERQYPAENNVKAKAVSDIFKEVFSAYHSKDYKISEFACNDIKELHIDHSEKNGCNNLYYNDTLNEMYETGNVVLPSDMSYDDLSENEKLPVKGQDVYCLDCGELLDDSDSLYCCDCDPSCDDDDEW